jgi:hypothetical protein
MQAQQLKSNQGCAFAADDIQAASIQPSYSKKYQSAYALTGTVLTLF